MMDTENCQGTLREMWEIAAESALMDAQQYEDFRAGALQACDEKVEPFLCRISSIIDAKRRGEDNAKFYS